HVDPVAIIQVLDRNGKILEQATPAQKSVISEASAAELTSMLQDVVTKGTGTRAAIGRPAAGKTGTTSDYRDAWFVGYTPDLVAGVWVGNDSNESLAGMHGGDTPAIIWKSFMQKATANMPARNFDNSAYGSGKSGIGEMEDDESIRSKKKEKADSSKTDKKAQEAPPQKGDRPQGKTQGNDAVTPPTRDNRNSVPEPVAPAAPEPVPAAPQPETVPEAAPAGEAPTPGGGASKGRN
ncbi:MAG: hypothetical protein IJR38_06170, partial [Selenomonadaceae bacterium]|nr:hypothetical protein [Selenomonadaceae bacterium]